MQVISVPDDDNPIHLLTNDEIGELIHKLWSLFLRGTITLEEYQAQCVKLMAEQSTVS